MGRTFYHTDGAGASTDRALHHGSAMIVSVKHPLLLSAALLGFASPAFAQQSLPALPASGGASGGGASAAPPPAAGAAQAGQAAETPQASQPAAGGLTPQQLYDHVRRGLVVLERNGLPMAIGTVLGSDGRILTALSGLNGGDGADVLYADGTTVHAKVGQSDKGNDLALLIPQAAQGQAPHTDGLSASGLAPTVAQLRAMIPVRGARLAPAQAGVKGPADAHGRDGQSLAQMLDIDVKGPLFAGAPLLDSAGNVVAVLVRACKGAAPAAAGGGDDAWAAWGNGSQAAAKAAACSPVVVGAPVSTIRSFLTAPPSLPAAAPTPPAPAAWLGIRGEPEMGGVKGVHVIGVAPQSPAEASGLKSNADIIAAVDGEPVDTPEKLSAAIGKHAPGDTVKLLVYGQGKFREVSVALRAH
jgi:S1-C subfamily serine protease